MNAAATPSSEVVFPGRRWHVAIAGPEPLPNDIDLFAAVIQAEIRELEVAAALAEAFGLAWIEHERGGIVEISGAAESHPWWPALRTWLPTDAPLRLVEAGVGEPLAHAPWPPVALASLPRSGVPPFPLTGVSDAFDWLAEHEPHLLLIEATADETHPALVVAHAAIAGQGVRVCWRITGSPDWLALLPALTHIGRRQQPVQLVVDELPPSPIPGWWIATPTDASTTASALTNHLQHEWPGIIVVQARLGATVATAWEPGRLCILRAGPELTVCLPDEVDRIQGPVACPTTVQPAPRDHGVRFAGPPAWAAALGY